MAWITASDVKQYSQVNHNLLGFPSDEEYASWIARTLIPHCEAIIEGYCGQSFSDASASGGLRTVCAILASRTLQHMIMNASGPITHVIDSQIRVASQEVFSQDLKHLLGPHVKPRHNLRSTDYPSRDAENTWNE